jgi:peptide chain release factor 1
VTVAVVDPNVPTTIIKEADLRIEWYSGTGAGGQYRNKHQNSCRITHVPTGITVKSECRSRTNSLAEAMTAIQKRVDKLLQHKYNVDLASDRKLQVGTGMRGDKIRTYRFQDDRVQDHITGKSGSVKKVIAGNFDLLW